MYKTSAINLGRVIYFLIIIFVAGVIPSCESCNRIVETCDAESVEDKHLCTVTNPDYDKIISMKLNGDTHYIEVCQKHFSVRSAAFEELKSAVEEVNRQENSNLKFELITKGIKHKSPEKITSGDVTNNSYFDYINLDKDLPAKCSLQSDTDFAMSKCCTASIGSNCYQFAILVSSWTYDHFDDPSSTHHPKKDGILHELMHAAGMMHTPKYWAEKDKDYISTMQGHLEYLSALDVAFLREYYPSETTNYHCNFVASSTSRTNKKVQPFDEINPSSLCINSDGQLLDYVTGELPEFEFAWFNTGNLSSDGDNLCGTNRVSMRFLEDPTVPEIQLKWWRITEMPALSQDQWKGVIEYTYNDAPYLFRVGDWELKFEVNSGGVLTESTREDNIITMPITVFSSCNNTP